MVGAKWDDASGKWRVSIQRPKKDSQEAPSEVEVFEDTADLLFTGIGSLSRWNWPDIEGLHNFKGTLIHSAQWEVPGSASDKTPITPILRKGWQESVKDWGNKRVAVIGVVNPFFVLTFSALNHLCRVPQEYRSSLHCNQWWGKY